jgi:molybdopterin-containing oxidoreductase family membrane subunit
MTELLSLFQSFFVNQAFLATLLLITLNNIWKKVEIKTPLQIIRYVLIVSGFTALVGIFISQVLTPDSEGNTLSFINRATGPYKVYYIAMLCFSVILPFLLLIQKLGTSKYFVLIVSFLIVIGYWFERLVIIVTSLHRGHMPSSWNLWHSIFYFTIFVILPVLLLFNIIMDLIKRIKG